MIHTLESISLADFIRVYDGQIEYAGESKDSIEDKNKASDKMIMEYLEIVGGKTISFEISKKNEQLNNEIRVYLMDSCENLINLGDWDSVTKIIDSLGYKLFPSDHNKIRQRIKIIRSTAKLKLDITSDKKEQDAKIEADHFIKERVMAISHFKMHIDPNVYRAKEYAYLIRRMCDEISNIKSKKRQ